MVVESVATRSAVGGNAHPGPRKVRGAGRERSSRPASTGLAAFENRDWGRFRITTPPLAVVGADAMRADRVRSSLQRLSHASSSLTLPLRSTCRDNSSRRGDPRAEDVQAMKPRSRRRRRHWTAGGKCLAVQRRCDPAIPRTRRSGRRTQSPAPQRVCQPRTGLRRRADGTGAGGRARIWRREHNTVFRG